MYPVDLPPRSPMKKFIVDTQQTITNTYTVLAESAEDAASNYADGSLVHSENSGTFIGSVEEDLT